MCTNHVFSRYKRKQKEKDSELAKLRKECDELRAAEIRALKAKKEEIKENEDIKVNFNFKVFVLFPALFPPFPFLFPFPLGGKNVMFFPKKGLIRFLSEPKPAD